MTDHAHKQLYDLRQRVLAGEEMTAEEYARVIETLRNVRSERLLR